MVIELDADLDAALVEATLCVRGPGPLSEFCVCKSTGVACGETFGDERSNSMVLSPPASPFQCASVGVGEALPVCLPTLLSEVVSSALVTESRLNLHKVVKPIGVASGETFGDERIV